MNRLEELLGQWRSLAVGLSEAGELIRLLVKDREGLSKTIQNKDNGPDDLKIEYVSDEQILKLEQWGSSEHPKSIYLTKQMTLELIEFFDKAINENDGGLESTLPDLQIKGA